MRKFEINFTITDLEPCDDNRDIHAIMHVLINNFGNTYELSPISVKEIKEKTSKDYLHQSLNQNPLYSDPYR